MFSNYGPPPPPVPPRLSPAAHPPKFTSTLALLFVSSYQVICVRDVGLCLLRLSELESTQAQTCTGPAHAAVFSVSSLCVPFLLCLEGLVSMVSSIPSAS